MTVVGVSWQTRQLLRLSSSSCHGSMGGSPLKIVRSSSLFSSACDIPSMSRFSDNLRDVSTKKNLVFLFISQETYEGGRDIAQERELDKKDDV